MLADHEASCHPCAAYRNEKQRNSESHLGERQPSRAVHRTGRPEHSTIPLNQTAIDTLRAIPRRLDSKYVFTGKTPDKPFYDLKRQFENAVKKAGLEGVTFHILRHTTGSHLTMSGVDLRTVQLDPPAQVNLDDPALCPPVAGHKKSAVDALENALSGAVEKSEKHA